MRPSSSTGSAAVIEQAVASDDCEDVQFLIADELQRLHEGVLARYGIVSTHSAVGATPTQKANTCRGVELRRWPTARPPMP